MDQSDLEAIAQEALLTPDLALIIFNNSPDAIIVADEQGIIKLVNSQAELLFGYHKTELRGQYVEMLIPDAVRDRHRYQRESYTEHPQIRPMGTGLDLRAKKKNGKEVAVEINLSPASTIHGMFIIAIIRRRG